MGLGDSARALWNGIKAVDWERRGERKGKERTVAWMAWMAWDSVSHSIVNVLNQNEFGSLFSFRIRFHGTCTPPSLPHQSEWRRKPETNTINKHHVLATQARDRERIHIQASLDRQYKPED